MSESEVRGPSHGGGKREIVAQRPSWVSHVALVVAIAALAVGLNVRGEAARDVEIAGWLCAAAALLVGVLVQVFRAGGQAGSRPLVAPYGVMILGLVCLASARLLTGAVAIAFGTVAVAMSVLACGWFIVLISRSRRAMP
jgi:hypothetical protein